MSSSPHDSLFKSVFGEVAYARAELASVLPLALSQRIDWSTLALLPGSFVDEALSSSESDLLFEARCDGAELRLHLLFEHQSTADPRMPFRLLRYMVRVGSARLVSPCGPRAKRPLPCGRHPTSTPA